MGLIVTSAPSTEPITTAEAKTQTRVDDSTDDATLDAFTKGCRIFLERQLNRTLVSTTYEWTRDGFPPGGGGSWDSFSQGGFRRRETFYVPRPPLASVTSIQYIDEDGVTQTLAASKYTVDTASDPGRIYPNIDEFWPDTQSVNSSVTVTYIGGYGALTAVPEDIKICLKLIMASWYENREQVITGTMVNQLPFGAEVLIANNKVEDHLLDEDFSF